MSITTDRLLRGVKRRVTMPANQSLMADTDILELADDEIKSRILPIVVAARQEYYTRVIEIPTVADQQGYQIPRRSIGRGLRDLKLLDSAGSITRDLNLIQIEDEHMFMSSGTTMGFYFKGDKVYLIPTPTSALLTLQMWVQLPPSNLVTTDSAARVTGISAGSITVASVPTTLTTGTVIDFVSGRSGHETLNLEKTITNIAGSIITFVAADVPSDLAVGDYISVFETSPVVQIPDEVYPLLETGTCIRVLEAVGDFEGIASLEKKRNDEEKAIKVLLEPRIIGENTKIINRRSLLRGSRARYTRGLIY